MVWCARKSSGRAAGGGLAAVVFQILTERGSAARPKWSSSDRTRNVRISGSSTVFHTGSPQISAERLSRSVGEPVMQQRGTLPDDVAGLDGPGRHDRAASGG